ncbi:UvrD-helicase domain-containing protein [Fusibacter ferrireducens]|uniref:ATP-dependent helicase n=1 Tax=Fusibacter ferrireducens TaxID=2785058 RepID=A0ABR9ZY60_9FIRM|nr:UvrD-helicase domain-containing protein [Fusibacter ferrireducens]MBF4695088.1 ATP-dependent helicase [Fusibacter ferrireducens]
MKENKRAHELAEVICSKPSDISFEDCFNSEHKGRKICFDCRTCIIEEKSDEQVSYVVSDIDKNIHLSACPGSGKTEVVGLKAAYELERWTKESGGVAILTFTNNAADVIQERVHRFVGQNKGMYPHFIGTIDSWIHGYITHPYGWLIFEVSNEDDKSFIVVDEKSDASWLSSFTCKVPYCFDGKKGYEYAGITANKIFIDLANKDVAFIAPRSLNKKIVLAKDYFETDAYKAYLNGEIITRYINAKPKTAKKLQTELFKAKKEMFKRSLATYRDMEYIAYRVLKIEEYGKRVAKRFPLLIIDECQDLSSTQLRILKKLEEYGVKIHMIGDINQSIYAFKGVKPQYIEDHTSEQNYKEMKLSNNYRSCCEIVGVFDKIVPKKDVKSVPETLLEEPCIVTSYTEKDFISIQEKFSDYVHNLGLQVEKSAIVARGWKIVNNLSAKGYSDRESNKSLLLAEAIVWWKSNIYQLRLHAIDNIGEILSLTVFKKCKTDSRYHYLPEYVKSNVLWRRCLSSILESVCSSDILGDVTMTWTKWAAIARKELPVIVKRIMLENIDEEYHKYFIVEELKIQALKGNGAIAVKETVSTPNLKESKVRITTIHQVKGETLDALMLVSNTKHSGGDGYWENWIKDSSTESARLAYVASSRPKHLLVWALPQLQAKDIEKLEALGFKYIPLKELGIIE